MPRACYASRAAMLSTGISIRDPEGFGATTRFSWDIDGTKVPVSSSVVDRKSRNAEVQKIFDRLVYKKENRKKEEINQN